MDLLYLNKTIMNLSIDQLQKANPIYQALVAIVLSVIGIICSKLGIFDAKNDWNIICYGLLCFVVANPILGILQSNTMRYLSYSLGCIMLYLLIFLFAGKFGLISSISDTSLNQTIIIAFLVFYIVLSVISIMMKAFYKMTQ